MLIPPSIVSIDVVCGGINAVVISRTISPTGPGGEANGENVAGGEQQVAVVDNVVEGPNTVANVKDGPNSIDNVEDSSILVGNVEDGPKTVGNFEDGPNLVGNVVDGPNTECNV